MNKMLVENINAVGIPSEDSAMLCMWDQDFEDPTAFNPNATCFSCGTTGAVWKWAGARP